MNGEFAISGETFMSNKSSEAQSLELLSDMHRELRDALSALGGKPSQGLIEGYRVYTARHINVAVEAYIYLRESCRIEASKHLIRTAIEAVIRLEAIHKKPQLLFNIAFSEFQEKKKLVRSQRNLDTGALIKAIDAQWADFVQNYRTRYPDHTVNDKELTLRAMAECAGIEGFYDNQYRLYCSVTHAALQAITGGLRDFEKEDNRTMSRCALAGLEALVTVGAPAPNLSSLKERFAPATITAKVRDSSQ